MAPVLVAVMGPTASGKSALAESLADRLDARLLAADAFQVYRGFDIGTAKPEPRDRYGLLDFKDPDETCTVVDWIRHAQAELNACWERGQSVVLVGGTGFYIRALLERYGDLASAPDAARRQHWMELERAEGPARLVQELIGRHPDLAERTDLKNPLRVRRALERLDAVGEPFQVDLPPYSITKLAISTPASILDLRILERLKQMVQNGWVLEVRRLRASGVTEAMPAMRALGYRTLWGYIEGKVEYQQALEEVALLTRRYAKRQRTWLRSEPNLHSVSGELALDEQVRMAIQLIQVQGKGNGEIHQSTGYVSKPGQEGGHRGHDLLDQ